MRVASFQFIQRNLDNISARSSEANRQLGQMSSGKRVEYASDDPVAANGILNYKQELRKIDQYQNNINLAENRLRREETGLTSGENITQQIKEIMLGANNPAITQNERDAYKSQLQSHIDEMLDIANSKDEFGQAIFGGFQTDNDPFTRQPDGSVSYSGDSGQREMMVGDSVKKLKNCATLALVKFWIPTQATANKALTGASIKAYGYVGRFSVVFGAFPLDPVPKADLCDG